MRLPWINIALLLLIILQFVTGWFGFTSGNIERRWILWLHGIGAYAIVVLAFGKAAIIANVWRRGKRWTASRIGFVILLLLTLLTLIFGLLWTFYGPIYVGGFSLVSLHIYLSIVVLLLLAWHSWRMRWIWRVRGSRNRSAFVKIGSTALLGAAVWGISRKTKELLDLPGSRRRFTGSYEIGSFGGRFPTVSWINDNPAPIDPMQWRLRLNAPDGALTSYTLEQLSALPAQTLQATLDCTGGFYSVQRWHGVPMRALIDDAQLSISEVRSVLFTSVTGYRRRFPVEEAQKMLLATGIEQTPLTHGHGFPLRLVAPGRRGVEWVKWIDQIEFSRVPAFLQLPLPIQ